MKEEATIQHIEAYLKAERSKRQTRTLLTIILVPVTASILVIALWRDYATAG